VLIPGWHDVDIKYGNSPRAVGGASSSVLRLFVIDAAQVRENGGARAGLGHEMRKSAHLTQTHALSLHPTPHLHSLQGKLRQHRWCPLLRDRMAGPGPVLHLDRGGRRGRDGHRPVLPGPA
jgi:hypothetical protein